MRIGEKFDSLFEIEWFYFLNISIEGKINRNVFRKMIKPFLHHSLFSMLAHVQEEGVFVIAVLI